jgi:hypothetical protein
MAAGNPAYAVVNRALAAAGQERDRTYRIADRCSGQLSLTREGTLYVRGDRFVFRLDEGPLFPGLLLGSNGRQGWAVRPDGPVVVSDDPAAFFRVMTRGLLPRQPEGDHHADRELLPILQQRTLLERLGRSYRLELLAREALTADDDTRYQHLRAHRQQDGAGGADVVDLWVHPDTGVVARLRLQSRLPRVERLVTLDLVSQEPLAPDWYEPSAHHKPGRPVKAWAPGEDLPLGGMPPPGKGKP